ncbi:hypothetical protein [Streptomyces sp. NPDC047315]|uniref:hypothetical protein n=1 Tax=Streptomyces sp. NPDC047315 TaxID=3155142 RepID=UPI0034004F91
MSTPPIERLDIVVGRFPMDGSLIEHRGTYTLFLRPQTFSSAVRHVRNVLPHITLEAAESMVREQCPEFKDFDELLGLNEPPVPRVELPADPPMKDVGPVRRKRHRRVVLVAALLPALAASWAVGRYTNVADTSPAETKAMAPEADTQAEPAPFVEPRFEFFAGSSKIDCDPISTLEAECTDADGMVMSTKAATGPDSTIFSFSYGAERIGLRIFLEPEYASVWARQGGSQELYPHMKVHGRYVLWGTDPGRVRDYADLLVQADQRAPLPPRLAALTLGTLGLDNTEVNQILAQPAAAVADAPALMAARMVLGIAPAPVGGVHEGDDDIVALAVGIEPDPPAVDPPAPAMLPVAEPSSGTGSGSGSGAPSTAPAAGGGASPAVPPTDTKPPAETSTPSTPAPVATPKPATPPEPTDPTVKPEEPSTPEVPSEEAPSTPPESTDPPSEEPDGPEAPPAEESPDEPSESEEDPEEQKPPAGAPDKHTDGEPDDADDLLFTGSAWSKAA